MFNLLINDLYWMCINNKYIPFERRKAFLSKSVSFFFLIRKTQTRQGDWNAVTINCACCLLSRFNSVQLFASLWTVACQAPLSMGSLHARVLEWIAMPSSRGSSWLRDWTHISYDSCIGCSLPAHPISWEAQPITILVYDNQSSLYSNRYSK